MEAAPYKALLPKSEGEEEAKDEAPAKTEAPPPSMPEDLPDDPSAERPDDAAWRLDILKTRLLGMGLLALGMIIAGFALKVFRKLRYFVVVRTHEGMMRIRVSGKVQQDIILATLQAVK